MDPVHQPVAVEEENDFLSLSRRIEAMTRQMEPLLVAIERCKSALETAEFKDDGVQLPLVREWMDRIRTQFVHANPDDDGFTIEIERAPKCLHSLLSLPFKVGPARSTELLEPTPAERRAMRCLHIGTVYRMQTTHADRKRKRSTAAQNAWRRECFIRGVLEDDSHTDTDASPHTLLPAHT